MKKQINVFTAERKIEVWNEIMNRWEKCSFDESGIYDEDENEIEAHLRDMYQERGYNDIDITFCK